jgi:hypothetical protein
MTTMKTTGTRVTVRLTAADESALSTLTAAMRPRFSLVNKSDLIRAAIQKAAQAVIATGAIG